MHHAGVVLEWCKTGPKQPCLVLLPCNRTPDSRVIPRNLLAPLSVRQASGGPLRSLRPAS